MAWYQRANARSDYAERVLGAVGDLLAESRTALDVGAGFGALAVPLARRLARVTAIEPAPAMARALKESASREGLRNVVVLEAAWDEVVVAPHDVVVCAHVSNLLEADSAFLSVVSLVARKGVVIIRNAPGGEDKFFFDELYPRLLGRPYERCCESDETVQALGALGIAPAVTTIEYASDQPFLSLDEACDFWTEYMELSPSTRAFLRGFLGERLRHEGRWWIAPLRKRAAVIQWRTRPGRG